MATPELPDGDVLPTDNPVTQTEELPDIVTNPDTQPEDPVNAFDVSANFFQILLTF